MVVISYPGAYSLLVGPHGADPGTEDTMTEDRYDALFEDDGEMRDDGTETNYLALMGSEDVEPGLDKGDGFYISHEVRVTEPWRPSLVRLDERPRVGSSRGLKRCAQCRAEFKGINRAKYCGAEDCSRARAAQRKAASRA